MANKLLIVHGYSDGSTSFTALGDLLITAGARARRADCVADDAVAGVVR